MVTIYTSDCTNLICLVISLTCNGSLQSKSALASHITSEDNLLKNYENKNLNIDGRAIRQKERLNIECKMQFNA